MFEKSKKRKATPKKIADYLYYMELDDYHYEGQPHNEPQFTGGCSSVRKGNFYGRNLDLPYGEVPEFIVRIRADADRYESVGVCANPAITCNVQEMTEKELHSMPSITNDGINENGVIVSVNVVEPSGVDDMSGTAPGKEKIHSTRLVRYLLDRAKSAEHAVEIMKNLDIVGGYTGYGLHWMIADEKDTYVVEIIDRKIVISRNENHYMTNFYLNYGPKKKEQYIAGECFEDLPLLNDFAIGVERWCTLREGYKDAESVESMTKLLESVRATAMYDKEKRPPWYTECTGGSLSIYSSKSDFEKAVERQIGRYERRDRTHPQGDWNTWHTSVYDIGKRTLYVYSQENYSESFAVSLL